MHPKSNSTYIFVHSNTFPNESDRNEVLGRIINPPISNVILFLVMMEYGAKNRGNFDMRKSM